MKIKTRQIAARGLRSATCRSTTRRAVAEKRRPIKPMPRLIPEGVAELILQIALELRRPSDEGKWIVSASAIHDLLRSKYLIKVSIPWILKRLEKAGYATDKGGRPRDPHDSRLDDIVRLRSMGMSLTSIGGELGGLSRQRISVLLKEATTDEETKK